jgi:hypothetical protein
MRYFDQRSPEVAAVNSERLGKRWRGSTNGPLQTEGKHHRFDASKR